MSQVGHAGRISAILLQSGDFGVDLALSGLFLISNCLKIDPLRPVSLSEMEFHRHVYHDETHKYGSKGHAQKQKKHEFCHFEAAAWGHLATKKVLTSNFPKDTGSLIFFQLKASIEQEIASS